MTSTPSPATWSCDERDRAGNCRSAHGCHCREIATQALLLSQRESDIERLTRETRAVALDDALDRAESAEARLQQTRGFLTLLAEMPDFPGDPRVATVLRGYRDAARTILAAIQPPGGA